jgi:phosphoketolase
MKTKTLNPELLSNMDACWRAANYLSVGKIYLYGNPLLKRPLTGKFCRATKKLRLPALHCNDYTAIR